MDNANISDAQAKARLNKWARNYLLWSIIGTAAASIFYVVMQQQYHNFARWPTIPAVIFIHAVILGGMVVLLGFPSFAFVAIIRCFAKLAKLLWPTPTAEWNTGAGTDSGKAHRYFGQ
jgi:lipid-A-disaccharide synthase-like uncharacterized protein